VYMGTTGGNVGIGTATPGSKLDVNGNTNITGDLTVSGVSKIILPTSNPGAGILWNNGGVVTIGT